MSPIIALPALAGMTYPKLEENGLMQVVPSLEDIPSLSEAARAEVQVLMTSATRGCGVKTAEALPNLGLVVSQGAGSDRIDIEGLAARGVRVRCVGETVTEDVADLAMALTFMVSRGLVRADAFARGGDWVNGRFEVGESVYGKTMGIAGLSGRIGQAIARRAKASNMKIAGLARSSNEGLGATLYGSWLELAQASDVLVLAVPGTPDLNKMIGATELAALGPKGRIINVGRGNLVDTDALIHALENGIVGGAGLDVLDGEPAVPARLAALKNVVLTPHVGAQTWGQRERGARVAEDEILAFLSTAER